LFALDRCQVVCGIGLVESTLRLAVLTGPAAHLCALSAAVYEALLKDYCNIAKEKRCLSDAMIDGACLNAPKVALVSALTSMSPAVPFVFRTYELPPAAQALHASICAHPGSSKHAVWQAVRASSGQPRC
jgi:hypothetical protein